MKVTGQERTIWPVLEVDGRILWMLGAVVEPDTEIRVVAEQISSQNASDRSNASPTSPD